MFTYLLTHLLKVWFSGNVCDIPDITRFSVLRD